MIWLDGADDLELAHYYREADCLLAASFDEGFGLPLVEAARAGLPLICRDIPIFREVSQGHAFFFKAEDGGQLVEAMRDWLNLFERDAHPKSSAIVPQSWDTTAKEVLAVIRPERSHRPSTSFS